MFLWPLNEAAALSNVSAPHVEAILNSVQPQMSDAELFGPSLCRDTNTQSLQGLSSSDGVSTVTHAARCGRQATLRAESSGEFNVDEMSTTLCFRRPLTVNNENPLISMTKGLVHYSGVPQDQFRR